jgi:hypothetical protein
MPQQISVNPHELPPGSAYQQERRPWAESMKKNFCILALALFVTAAWAEYSPIEDQRGFLFEIGGGGFSFTKYGSAADSALSRYASFAAADRIKVYVDIRLGWAISQNLYLVGSVDGFGDAFFAGTESLDQLNSVLYSVGVRYYPFVTGLVLGADAGASVLTVTSNATGVGSTPLSAGIGLTLAWDFGGTPKGVTAEIGMRAIYLAVNNPVIASMFGATPFVNLVVKR